jgi:uncharacterized protein YjbJ (UPF0337 family)
MMCDTNPRAPSLGRKATVFKNEEQFMNWDQIEGKWKQFKGSARQQWGKLTDDDLAMIAGSREKFVGKLQEHYGITKDEAQRRADDWARTLRDEPGEKAFTGRS